MTEQDNQLIQRLRLVLVEKAKEVPADNLELIREYIQEIRELGKEIVDEEPPQPKPILDYKGRVFVRGINSHIWLTDREMRLVELLAQALEFDVIGDWHGRLHILVELVEEGDDG